MREPGIEPRTSGLEATVLTIDTTLSVINISLAIIDKNHLHLNKITKIKKCESRDSNRGSSDWQPDMLPLTLLSHILSS